MNLLSVHCLFKRGSLSERILEELSENLCRGSTALLKGTIRSYQAIGCASFTFFCTISYICKSYRKGDCKHPRH